MKLKQTLAFVLAAIIALSLPLGARADEVEAISIEAISADLYDFVMEMELPNFGSITGKVLDVQESEHLTSVSVERGESRVVFYVTPHTYLHGEMPQAGDVVTGFYDTWLPIAMIYPPMLTAVVLINQESGLPTVFVDRFYKTETFDGGTELISADGQRRLNANNPETVIVSQGGQDAADWPLDGRLLAVFYSVASRSMPPLIFAPEKIVVMYEIAVHPGPAEIDWDNGDGFMGIVPPIGDISDIEWDMEWENEWDGEYHGIEIITDDSDFVFHDIVINGIGLEGHTFMSADGVFPTHVPVRAIAESLGITVDWQRPLVHLRGEWGEIAFRTNSYYVIKDGEVITLAAPNIVQSGTMYMPLEFFRRVAGFTNAYSVGGTVFINNFDWEQ
jgi:hypothetical protein